MGLGKNKWIKTELKQLQYTLSVTYQ